MIKLTYSFLARIKNYPRERIILYYDYSSIVNHIPTTAYVTNALRRAYVVVVGYAGHTNYHRHHTLLSRLLAEVFRMTT